MLFTSESVSEGHPDKMADLISDTVLDAALAQDPSARVACETFLTAGEIIIGGEITTTAEIDYEKTVRQAIREIDPEYEAQAKLRNNLVEQSPDIAAGIAGGGAGDQGLMFGYSTTETPERLPLPIALAHRLIRRYEAIYPHTDVLKADAKSQVTVDYSGDKPRLDTVLMSVRHSADIDLDYIWAVVETFVIRPELYEYIDENKPPRILVNPAGNFVLGGPLADSGLTGRKIIVDTYGGWARHGGGAFSGKDATKVDRSAAYMARYIANHIVEAGAADECEIQLAYAIGVTEPVSITVNTDGKHDANIERAIRKTFDLTPAGIIRELGLDKPIFAATATGGHFGRSEFKWEQTPRLAEFKANLDA